MTLSIGITKEYKLRLRIVRWFIRMYWYNPRMTIVPRLKISSPAAIQNLGSFHKTKYFSLTDRKNNSEQLNRMVMNCWNTNDKILMWNRPWKNNRLKRKTAQTVYATIR